MFSCEFYQLFQNAVFAKHLWVTGSAFVCYVDLNYKRMFPSTLVILDIFEANTMDCLQTAQSGT